MSKFNIKLKPEHLNISSFRVAPRGSFDSSNETGVVILHLPTGLKAECSNKRSAHANRASALALLTEMIRVRLYPYKNGKSAPLCWNMLPKVVISNNDMIECTPQMLEKIESRTMYIQIAGRGYRVTTHPTVTDALAEAGRLMAKYQKGSYVYLLDGMWHCHPTDTFAGVKVGGEGPVCRPNS